MQVALALLWNFSLFPGWLFCSCHIHLLVLKIHVQTQLCIQPTLFLFISHLATFSSDRIHSDYVPFKSKIIQRHCVSVCSCSTTSLFVLKLCLPVKKRHKIFNLFREATYIFLEKKKKKLSNSYFINPAINLSKSKRNSEIWLSKVIWFHETFRLQLCLDYMGEFKYVTEVCLEGWTCSHNTESKLGKKKSKICFISKYLWYLGQVHNY